MPIFEFSCLERFKDSEILLRNAVWKSKVECPTCGLQQLGKMLSVFSATFAGGSMGVSELPPCSGMPSNCGRCTVDN